MARVNRLHSKKNVRRIIFACSELTNLLGDLDCTQFNETRSSAIAEGPRDALCQLKSCELTAAQLDEKSRPKG